MTPSSAGYFFEEPIPEPHCPVEPYYANDPFRPPINMVPKVLPWVIFLARTDDTVLVIGDVRVYRTGFLYSLFGWLRPGTEPQPPRDAPWEGPSRPQSGWLLDGRVKIGAKPNALSPGDQFAPGDPRAPRQAGCGSEDQGIAFAQRRWVYPLPVGQSLDLFFAWPERGIPERRIPVDLAEIMAAGPQTTVLWELPAPPETPDQGDGGRDALG